MVTRAATHDDDIALARACLNQEPSAVQALRDTYHVNLRSVLLRRGASFTEAEDLLWDLWGDLLAGKNGGEPLLTRYHGRCSIKVWLITVATHRLVDLKRRARFQGELRNSGNDDEEEEAATPFDKLPGPVNTSPDKELAGLLHRAVHDAIKASTPEERVMLRLVYIENLSQREVAQMWHWHESKISRFLTAALTGIEERALGTIRKADPSLEFTLADLLDLCDGTMELLLQGSIPPSSQSKKQSSRK